MFRPIRIASLLAVAGVAAACGRSETDKPVDSTTTAGTTTTISGKTASARGTSLVRLVNAFPATKNIDVTVNGQVVFAKVAAHTVTAYVEIESNRPQFAMRGAGKDSTMAENGEIVMDGRRYTAVALPKKDGTSALRLWRDDLVPDSGKARVRIIHAAPGIEDVKVGIVGQTDPLFSSIGYANEAGFKDVLPAEIVLVVRRMTEGTPALTLKSMHLVAGHAYTIVLVTTKGNLDSITFEDGGQGTVASR
jgi:hypothetical protein